MLKTIDERVSQVLTHPTFLRSASLVINLNSYRRKWTRPAVRSALVSLEIPVRTDQEKMLALLEQLNSRIQDLETRSVAPAKHTSRDSRVSHANH